MLILRGSIVKDGLVLRCTSDGVMLPSIVGEMLRISTSAEEVIAASSEELAHMIITALACRRYHAWGNNPTGQTLQ